MCVDRDAEIILALACLACTCLCDLALVASFFVVAQVSQVFTSVFSLSYLPKFFHSADRKIALSVAS